MRLGVDVGSVRVGMAACDPDGLVATAVETLARDLPAPARRGAPRGDAAPRDPEALPADVLRLAAEVRERRAVEVVVGLPRSLSGDEGRAASIARQYAGRLADVVAPVPVRLVDERLSTAGAHRALHEGGTSGRRHRAVVDQVAAAWILQTALDLERSSGRPPGSLARPLGPDGRRRDRAPVEPDADEHDRTGHDQHEPQHQHDDEVGRRTGALRTGEDPQGRTSSPHPEEDATVSTTQHPVPRPPRRAVLPSPAAAARAEEGR
nr:Holliday junction resolvase RuvX [uncultured Pseudokineococcus sp.]